MICYDDCIIICESSKQNRYFVPNIVLTFKNIAGDYEFLKEDVYKLHRSNKWLKHCLNKTFECVSIMFDFPIDRLKSIINRYIKGNKNDKRNNKVILYISKTMEYH